MNIMNYTFIINKDLKLLMTIPFIKNFIFKINFC